jgi:TolB protein
MRMYHHASELHWSPDGKYLAFNVSANFGPTSDSFEPYESYLYVLKMGSNPPESYKIYSSPSGAVTWSPDSKKLAFVASFQENTEIYTANRDGTDLTMVYQNPEWVNNSPSTNPDFNGSAGIAGWLK